MPCMVADDGDLIAGQATRAHVNALIAASGPDITARARWLVRNNGYAANAVESWATNTVGDGIKPISQIAEAARKEELLRLWLAWTDEADAEGLTDFYGLQRRAAGEVSGRLRWSVRHCLSDQWRSNGSLFRMELTEE